MTILAGSCVDGVDNQADEQAPPTYPQALPQDIPQAPTIAALELIKEIAPYLLREDDEVKKGIESKGVDAHVRSDKRNDPTGDSNNWSSRTVHKTTAVNSDWQTYEATAYTARCDGCTGITKTGVDVRSSIYHEGKRVIAVDPRRVPLGSTVEVRLANGEIFEAVAIDIGGSIKGARIDVLHADKDSMRKFGRQAVEVRILR